MIGIFIILLIEIGVSGSYRYANGITMNKIYNSNILVVGNDYRWGFETQLNYKDFGFQSEYVQANINKDRAWGYYADIDFYFTKTIQATVEMEYGRVKGDKKVCIDCASK